MRALHKRRGLPLISALHDPHLPALQFQRHDRVVSWLAWMWWIASNTTMPGKVGTLYSCSAPPSALPRNTRRVTLLVVSDLAASLPAINNSSAVSVGLCKLALF